MKPINNYESVPVMSEAKKLPEGVYKIKILGVKYQDNSDKNYSDQLIIQFDIAEGEYKGFYQEQYKANTQEDKKYKGIYRLYVPVDDGSEKDNWSKMRFKTFTTAVEESNSGYVWKWDEQTLKDKVVGAVFNLKEYEYNGRNGFFTNLYKIIPVSEMANAKVPEPTFLKGSSNNNNNSDDFIGSNGSDLDEIPFN